MTWRTIAPALLRPSFWPCHGPEFLYIPPFQPRQRKLLKNIIVFAYYEHRGYHINVFNHNIIRGRCVRICIQLCVIFLLVSFEFPPLPKPNSLNDCPLVSLHWFLLERHLSLFIQNSQTKEGTSKFFRNFVRCE